MNINNQAPAATMGGSSTSRDISALRVAQAELISGNTSGKVFIRLSPGSVAFLTDRPKAQEKIAKQLRQAVLEDSALLSEPSSSSS